jgi:hypothetical protein
MPSTWIKMVGPDIRMNGPREIGQKQVASKHTVGGERRMILMYPMVRKGFITNPSRRVARAKRPRHVLLPDGLSTNSVPNASNDG